MMGRDSDYHPIEHTTMTLTMTLEIQMRGLNTYDLPLGAIHTHTLDVVELVDHQPAQVTKLDSESTLLIFCHKIDIYRQCIEYCRLIYVINTGIQLGFCN